MEKTHLVDDLDGTVDSPESPVSSLSLTVNGRGFRLDLTAANRERLLRALQPYITAATPVSLNERAPNFRSRASRERARAIRVWAAENGHELQSTGRISNEVVHLWKAANGSP